MSFLQIIRRQPASLRLRCVCRTYATDPAPAESTTAKPTKKASAGPSSQKNIPVSSCPADTILPGVNYLKGQAPVVALEDGAYPEWLWRVLQPRVYEDDGPGGKKERVERRKVRQQAIKDRNFMQTQ